MSSPKSSYREMKRSKRTIGLGAGKRATYPLPSSMAVSRVMSGNRKRDTTPELAIRKLLHASGKRYRINWPVSVGNVRVRPDIVFRSKRIAIFVDGCFWHSCPQHGTAPRTNSGYWEQKFARNRERDITTRAALRKHGWSVIEVWEHEPPAELLRRLEALV